MKITEINCPHCGADIPYSDGQNEVKFCIFCGGVLDLKIDPTGNIIDEAANAESRYNQRIENEEELARKNYGLKIKKWQKLLVISYVISFLMIVLNIHFAENQNPFSIAVVIIFAFFLFAITPVFFFTCPKPPYETEKKYYMQNKILVLFTPWISVLVFCLAFSFGG